MLQVKRETIEHARFRALAQITIDKEKGIEAFEEYMKIAFPYLEASKKKERGDHIKALQHWVSKGPIGVQPLVMPKMKSRLVQTKSTRQKPQSPEEEQRLYRHLGRTI